MDIQSTTIIIRHKVNQAQNLAEPEQFNEKALPFAH